MRTSPKILQIELGNKTSGVLENKTSGVKLLTELQQRWINLSSIDRVTLQGCILYLHCRREKDAEFYEQELSNFLSQNAVLVESKATTSSVDFPTLDNYLISGFLSRGD